jgi:hypothetical protein
MPREQPGPVLTGIRNPQQLPSPFAACADHGKGGGSEIDGMRDRYACELHADSASTNACENGGTVTKSLAVAGHYNGTKYGSRKADGETVLPLLQQHIAPGYTPAARSFVMTDSQTGTYHNK